MSFIFACVDEMKNGYFTQILLLVLLVYIYLLSFKLQTLFDWSFIKRGFIFNRKKTVSLPLDHMHF